MNSIIASLFLAVDILLWMLLPSDRGSAVAVPSDRESRVKDLKHRAL